MVTATPDKWRDFLPGSGVGDLPTTGPAWVGPPDVRAAIVAAKNEAWAISWLDPAGWRDLPERAVIARNPLAAQRLQNEVGHILSAAGITIVTEAAA